MRSSVKSSTLSLDSDINTLLLAKPTFKDFLQDQKTLLYNMSRAFQVLSRAFRLKRLNDHVKHSVCIW